MVELQVREQTEALLREPLLGEGDADVKILRLLAGEYLRRLTQYRTVDQSLAQKYQMTFDEFFDRRTTVQHGNSWEVEKDAMEWENAIGGIAAMTRKLKEIEELTHASGQ